MKWTYNHGMRVLIGLAIVFVLALLLACGKGEPREPTPRIDDVYATANARIDEMQTAISADMTARAIPQR